jgi:cytochrome bd-type quinol oxidase subunit 1
MKFKNNWMGRLILGIVFSLFMLLVSLLFIIVLIPVFLVEFTAGFIGGTLMSIFIVVGAGSYYYIKSRSTKDKTTRRTRTNKKLNSKRKR